MARGISLFVKQLRISEIPIKSFFLYFSNIQDLFDVATVSFLRYCCAVTVFGRLRNLVP